MNETLAESHRRNYGECLERERVHLLTIGALQEENRDLVYALERFVDAAWSWHNFHKHVEGIQCDAMTPPQTITEALRDARAKAIFRNDYAALTPAQRQHVDELMARSAKYATKPA